MLKMTVKITNESPNSAPNYTTEQSAGADICAWTDSPNHAFIFNSEKAEDEKGEAVIRIAPNGRCKVDTGIHLQLPDFFEAQVRPRSGLSLKQGLVAILGTIDADYRGSIGVIVHNISNEVLTIHNGDRIAQLVIAPVAQIRFDTVAQLDETERGAGGFGSTGIK